MPPLCRSYPSCPVMGSPVAGNGSLTALASGDRPADQETRCSRRSGDAMLASHNKTSQSLRKVPVRCGHVRHRPDAARAPEVSWSAAAACGNRDSPALSGGSGRRCCILSARGTTKPPWFCGPTSSCRADIGKIGGGRGDNGPEATECGEYDERRASGHASSAAGSRVPRGGAGKIQRREEKNPKGRPHG